MCCVAGIKFKFVTIITAKDVSRIYIILKKKRCCYFKNFICISTRLMPNFFNVVRNNWMFRV